MTAARFINIGSKSALGLAEGQSFGMARDIPRENTGDHYANDN
jgi:hypothetical protein